MDGRGTWRDNVFVERLWRSVKYERVYLKAYDSVSAARADIADYLDWHNAHRSHSSLERLTRARCLASGQKVFFYRYRGRDGALRTILKP
jgi:transposase InsO family protein